MWLFGLITELDEKDIGKIIALTLISELLNFIFYYMGEFYAYGGIYFILLVIFYIIYVVVTNYLRNHKLKYIREEI